MYIWKIGYSREVLVGFGFYLCFLLQFFVGNSYFILPIILLKNKLEELSKSTKLVFFLVFLIK